MAGLRNAGNSRRGLTPPLPTLLNPSCRAFAQKNLGRILDVARKPLKHIWWQEAEKPWQALAACCEIAGALEVRGARP
jgi:DNA-directed RNA polymerase